MTFASRELSRDMGRPYELYLFELGSNRFGYTNAEQSILFDTVTYLPTNVSRTPVVSSAENRNPRFSVRLPGNNVFARLFAGVVPGERPKVTVRQFHYGDPDNEGIFVFQGTVGTVNWTDNLRNVNINCLSRSSTRTREIPREGYQGPCNNYLYDDPCGVDINDYEENAVGVVGVSTDGLTLTIQPGDFVQPNTPATATDPGSDYFEVGFVQFGNEYRNIDQQDGADLIIDLPFFDSVLGELVRVVPGCKLRLIEDCVTKYANGQRHNGWPAVPVKNPYTTGLD